MNNSYIWLTIGHLGNDKGILESSGNEVPVMNGIAIILGLTSLLHQVACSHAWAEKASHTVLSLAIAVQNRLQITHKHVKISPVRGGYTISSGSSNCNRFLADRSGGNRPRRVFGGTKSDGVFPREVADAINRR